MITVYEVVKFIHVFSAIIAVGFNASYGIWLRRAANEPEHTSHVLKTIKAIDDRFATPAYAVLLVSGLLMVAFYWPELGQFWVAAGLALYSLTTIIALGVYTPTLRRQIAIVEADGPSSPEFQSLARRGAIVGATLALLVVVIVFLMVTKPTL